METPHRAGESLCAWVRERLAAAEKRFAAGVPLNDDDRACLFFKYILQHLSRPGSNRDTWFDALGLTAGRFGFSDVVFEDLPCGGVEHILISDFRMIGDSVHLGYYAQALLQLYPGARVHVLVRENIAPVFTGCPAIAAAWSTPAFAPALDREDTAGLESGLARAGELIARLRQQRFDLSITFGRKPPVFLIQALDIQRRYGWYLDPDGRFAFRGNWWLHTAFSHTFLHLVEQFMRTLPAGMPWQARSPWPSNCPDSGTKYGLKPGVRYLGIVPGARFPSKCWPREYFVEIIRRLCGSGAMRAVIFGGAKERETAAWIGEQVPDLIVDLCARVPLDELGDVMSRCELVITNDTGPKHVAVSRGVPVIEISGGEAKVQKSGPYGPHALVLEADIPCIGCDLFSCPSHECMKRITPEAVERTVRIHSLLKHDPAGVAGELRHECFDGLWVWYSGARQPGEDFCYIPLHGIFDAGREAKKIVDYLRMKTWAAHNARRLGCGSDDAAVDRDRLLRPLWLQGGSVAEVTRALYEERARAVSKDEAFLAGLIDRACALLAADEICVFAGFADIGRLREHLTHTTAGLSIVIEPDAARFEAARNDPVLSRLLARDDVLMFGAVEPQAIARALYARAADIAGREPLFPVRPDVSAEYAQYWQDCCEVIRDAFRTAGARINDLARTGRILNRNSCRNLPAIVSAAGIKELAGAFAGVPAIVVSAGPSLDKNIGRLQKAGGKALILAVDTALPALMRRGIRPDLVFSGDFRDKSRFFDGIDTRDIPLVFHAETAPETVGAHHGARIVIAANNPLPQWIDTLTESKGTIERGMSVAHLAFNTALHMGCSPIILAGQDLAYGADSAYAAGTGVEGRAGIAEGKLMSVTSRYTGEQLTTREEFYIYLRYFEERIATGGVACINATEGGAGIAGARTMPLAEAIDSCTAAPFDTSRLQRAGTPAVPDAQIAAALSNMHTRIRHAAANAAEAASILEQVFTAVKAGKPAADIIAGLRSFETVYTRLKQDQQVLSFLHAELTVPLRDLNRSVKRGRDLTDIPADFTPEHTFCRKAARAAALLAEDFAELAGKGAGNQ